jgi:GNAT superfamily N-acetyltransferase
MYIREATVDDVPALVELWKEFMDFHAKREPFLTRVKDADAHWAEYVQENIESAEWLVLVADDEVQVVGFCTATVKTYPPVLVTKRIGFVQDLAVTAAEREKGIGEQLFQKAESWLRTWEIDRVEVNVAVANQTGQDFWRHMGFQDYLMRLAKKY